MIKYICDGCGKTAPARHNVMGDPINPSNWVTELNTEPNGDPKHHCGKDCCGFLLRPANDTALQLPIAQDHCEEFEPNELARMAGY